MPLIPKVPFVSGAVFTPEVATEMTGITFDNQPTYYGHFNKISDADLSDDPSAIKSRVGLLSQNLKVSAGNGLNANYQAGLLLYGTTLFTIGASSVSLTASSLNYIYGSTLGTILATSTPPPIIRGLLATVLTNTTGVVTVTDYRTGVQVETVQPFVLSVRNFGGRGDSGAFVATDGQTLSDGEYYFTNFTVGVGITLNINKLARIYCAGTVTIAGSIVVSPATAGGSVLAASSSGLSSGAGGAGRGNGGGQGEIPAETYNHIVSPVGSGGAGGYFATQGASALVYTSLGGSGGGCCWIEAAGNIVITGSVIANGTAGAPGVTIVNTPGQFTCNAGAGGGSGGLILLKSLTNIVVSGTLSAQGGAGGNGFSNGDTNPAGEAGSGGGGGRFFLAAPGINTTGATLNLGGGAAGIGFIGAGVITANGGVGGTYGGLGGTQVSNGVAGSVGQILTLLFTPIG